MKRPTIYPLLIGMVGVFALATNLSQVEAETRNRQEPNVGVCSMDDLSDWVGPLGDHQAKAWEQS